MDIDLRTVSLFVVIANIIQAFAIGYLYLGNRKYRGIGWWVLGSALPAVGFTLMFFRDIPSIEPVIVILSNVFIVGGSLFIYIGVMRFLDKREDLRLVIPVFLLFIVLYFYFTYVSDDITARTVIQSLVQGIYLFLTVSALLVKTPRPVMSSAYFIASVEFFLASFAIFRAGYVLFVSPVETFFTATMIQILSFIFYFICGLLLTIGLIIMINQRLNSDAVEANEHFELFFNTSPDAILISRQDNGKILNINEGFTDLTGIDRADAVGPAIIDLTIWKDLHDLQALNHELSKTGAIKNYETVLKMKDGNEVTCITSARSITLQGTPCVLSVIRDITDRKRAEEALQQANRKLNLLSSITRHDILNTISVLAGYLGLAREEPAEPKLRDYMDHLDVSVKKIQHQIEFTREYQDIGVNKATWQNLRDTVLKAASEFEMDGVGLNIDCENIEIFADPLLQKVFYNLFDNAFRYAPPFRTITVYCTEADEGLSVVFADDGVGISEDVRQHLFRSGFGNHTGLGLFLSREILAITGTTILENGEEGKGARFEMTVPKGAYRISGIGED